MLMWPPPPLLLLVLCHANVSIILSFSHFPISPGGTRDSLVRWGAPSDLLIYTELNDFIIE